MKPLSKTIPNIKSVCLLFPLAAVLTLGLSARPSSSSAYAQSDVSDETYRQVTQLGKNKGYQAGHQAGHAKGKAVDQDEVYQAAYKQGYGLGFEHGKMEGRRKGIEEGQRLSYNRGLAKGRQEGYSGQYPTGYREGQKEGARDGEEKGRPEGRQRCYEAGRAEGYRKGREAGYQEGLASDAYDQGYRKGSEEADAAATEEGLQAGRSAGYASRETAIRDQVIEERPETLLATRSRGRPSVGAFAQAPDARAEHFRAAEEAKKKALKEYYIKVYNEAYNAEYKRAYRIGYQKGLEESAAAWKRRGYQQGRARGAVEGHNRAFQFFANKNYPAYHDSGFEKGFHPGAEKGYREGYDAGYQETYDRAYRDFADRDYPEATSNGFQAGKVKGIGEGFQKAFKEKNQEGYQQGYEETREKTFPQAYARGHAQGEEQAQAHYDSSAILQLASVRLVDAPADSAYAAGEDIAVSVELVNYGGIASPPVALTAAASETGIVAFDPQPLPVGSIPPRGRIREELVLGHIDLNAGTNVPVSLDCQVAAGADSLGSRDLHVVSFNPETRRYQYLLAAGEDLRQVLSLTGLPQSATDRIDGILAALVDLRSAERLDNSSHVSSQAATLGRQLDALVAAHLTEEFFVEALPLLAAASIRLQYLLDVDPGSLPAVARQEGTELPALAEPESGSYSLRSQGHVRSGDKKHKFKYRLNFTRCFLIADLAAAGGFGLDQVHATLVANRVDEIKGLPSSPAVIYQLFTPAGEPHLLTREMAHADVENILPILPASLLHLPSAAGDLQEKQSWGISLGPARYPLHTLGAIRFAVKKTKEKPFGSTVEIRGKVLDQQDEDAGSCSFELQLPSRILLREKFSIDLRGRRGKWAGEIERLAAD